MNFKSTEEKARLNYAACKVNTEDLSNELALNSHSFENSFDSILGKFASLDFYTEPDDHSTDYWAYWLFRTSSWNGAQAAHL